MALAFSGITPEQLFPFLLLRQDPAGDLLASSWNREASVAGRAALGSSPLSLKWLIASYEKIRGANTAKWLKVLGENRLFLKQKEGALVQGADHQSSFSPF